MRILLLEDDFTYKESISEYLQSLGYEVDSVSDGLEACDKIAASSYHLFIFDVKVPNISGFEVLKYAKSLNIKTPIMLMTSLTDIDNIAIGYELGCNEYLKKPFELAELKFRVKELMRKYYGEGENSIIKIGEFEYDASSRCVKKNGVSINLSLKEIELIECLLAHKDAFVNILELKDEIWGDEEIDDANVRMHVRNIRFKTEVNFIISSRGLGYKINV